MKKQNALTELIYRSRMSQKDFAKAVGVTPSALSSQINKSKTPELFALEYACKLKIDFEIELYGKKVKVVF